MKTTSITLSIILTAVVGASSIAEVWEEECKESIGGLREAQEAVASQYEVYEAFVLDLEKANTTLNQVEARLDAARTSFKMVPADERDEYVNEEMHMKEVQREFDAAQLTYNHLYIQYKSALDSLNVTIKQFEDRVRTFSSACIE